MSKFESCFQEHREIAREAVRKSLVLLKSGKDSEKPFLPLDRNAKRVLVAGTHADDLGFQCGGWSKTWQGQSGQITIGMLPQSDFLRDKISIITSSSVLRMQARQSWMPSKRP